jgi:hypothetical protein
MGREATCICTWRDISADVTALLESTELILRGDISSRIPLSSIKNVRAEDGTLSFSVDDDFFALKLGGDTASKWAKSIANPPTLAKRLGITADTSVWMLGEADDSALDAALTEAKIVKDFGAPDKSVDLILARIDTPGDLASALRKSAKPISKGAALWLIYPKGKGHALTEAGVRSAARDIGLIDTKVASVSPTLTALRFSPHKSS